MFLQEFAKVLKLGRWLNQQSVCDMSIRTWIQSLEAAYKCLGCRIALWDHGGRNRRTPGMCWFACLAKLEIPQTIERPCINKQDKQLPKNGPRLTSNLHVYTHPYTHVHTHITHIHTHTHIIYKSFCSQGQKLSKFLSTMLSVHWSGKQCVGFSLGNKDSFTEELQNLQKNLFVAILWFRVLPFILGSHQVYWIIY